MKLGKASYGGGKHQHKIKDGDNVFRILPPMGELAEKGRWSVYYSIEWGFKGTDGRMKPFQNVRKVNRQSKMVEVESAAHLQRESIKEKQGKMVELFKKGKLTKEQMQPIKDMSMRFNLDNKHYLNAMSLDGKIGLLKIGARAMSALREEIKKLTEAGVDPLSVDNGRSFNFHRSGTGLDTQYQVTVYKEKKEIEIEGQKETVYRDVVHKLDDAVINRLSNEAFELSGMYPELSPEQVEEMVEAYELDLENFKVNEVAGATKVDEVFESVGKKPSPKAQEPKEEKKAEAKAEAPKEEVKQETAKEEVKEEVKTETKAETPKEEVKEETKAEAPKEESKKETSSSGEGEEGLSAEDEEFLKSLGA